MVSLKMSVFCGVVTSVLIEMLNRVSEELTAAIVRVIDPDDAGRKLL
jgi:hypothetical protein